MLNLNLQNLLLIMCDTFPVRVPAYLVQSQSFIMSEQAPVASASFYA